MILADQARQMAPSLSRGSPVVYILRLQSGILYVGCSTDVEARFRDHMNGRACRTTRLDPPKVLLWLEIQSDFPAARKREAQIKKWSRAKKEALISGDRARLRALSQSHRCDKSHPDNGHQNQSSAPLSPGTSCWYF